MRRDISKNRTYIKIFFWNDAVMSIFLPYGALMRHFNCMNIRAVDKQFINYKQSDAHGWKYALTRNIVFIL